MADNFDNYGMKVRATVDLPSVGDIDKQIRKLEKSISKLQVSGKLDDASLKALSHQLDTLKATVTSANFSPTALTELTNQVEKALGKVQFTGSLAKIGEDIGSSISQSIKKNIDSSSLIDSQNKLQNELNETDKSVQKVLYHFGELTKLGEQSAKSRTLGKGNSNSNYASLNSLTGLYLTDKKNELLKKTMSSSHNKYTGTDINAIDVSSYNLFVAETDEIAEKIKLFFSQIGELTSQLHRSEDTTEVVPSNLKIETVYSQMKELFGDVSLTYEQFENFIKNCRDIVSKYNLNDLLNPTNFKGNELPEEIRNMDSFQTQIMKMLGFEGLDLSKTSSYSGTNNVGTVVFDIGKDKIVEVKTYAEAIEELTKVEEKASSSISSTVVKNEERKQQAIRETLNMEEQSEKIKELAIQKANERKEVNNLRKEIEEETGVKVNVSDVKQAQKEVEKANKAQQEGTKENIKLREQELAHTKMLAKQTKANADLLDAQKKEELVQIKANNKEQLEGLKQERLQMEENAKLSSATSKKKVAETKAEANEQKALQTSLNTPEKEIKRKLDNDVYTTDIDKLEKKFVDYGLTVEQAKEKVSGLRNDLKELNKLSGDELIKKANDWESAFEKVEVQLEQTKLSYKDLDEVNKIQHSTDISDLETKYKKFGMVSEEVENNLKELKSAQEAVFKSQGTDGLGTALENYKTKLAETKASVKELTTTQVSMSQRVSQMTEMQDWMRKNKAATELCGDKIDELIQKCRTCDAVEFNNIKSEFKELKVAAGEAGKLGNTFLGSIKEQASKFVQWFSITSVVMEGVQAIKKMTQEVIAVDSAMIELRKVSDASNNDLKNYFDEAAKSAKDLGAAVSDVISATADWSRLGYSLDDSKKLAEVAILYKNVGDGIDVDTANESLVSTLRGFQLSAEDAMNIVDQFNEVANNFPIDSAGIGEALQRSAASFYEANTDLSKSIALITGTNSVIQDPDSVGTMWKTVSMRIRGATAELEEAGLETEGMVETTSQLQALVKGMTGFDIMKDEDTFKDIYEIVIGIGNEWQNLSDIEQASLLEALAGKRQGNALAAALNNISMIEDAYNTATNSAGSALEEQEEYEKGKILCLYVQKCA